MENKIKIGWFSFSCCEDNTIVMTEVMNDHWQEWKKIFDFRHIRIFKSKNIFDEFDIAFIEGAVASLEQEERIKAIRNISKKWWQSALAPSPVCQPASAIPSRQNKKKI